MSHIIETLMNWIFAQLAFVLEWKHFNTTTGIISLINPLAIAPQLYQVIAADSVAGVSWLMYVIFFLIQLVFCLVGIKAKNFGMMMSMLVSMLESLAIIIIVLIRS